MTKKEKRVTSIFIRRKKARVTVLIYFSTVGWEYLNG